MVGTAALRPSTCSSHTLLIAAFLSLVPVTAVPTSRQPIVRREEATLALNSEAASPRDLLREDTAHRGKANAGLLTDISATATVVRKSLEAACQALNKLEARVDKFGVDSGQSEFTVYMAAMAAWRDGHPGDQPACRAKQLSSSLCKDAAELKDMMWSVEGGSAWDSGVRELMDHELNSTECTTFATVPAPLYWNPAVAAAVPTVPGAPELHEGVASELQELVHDADYETFYALAGRRVPHFGPSSRSFWEEKHAYSSRTERVKHLSGFRVLRKTVSKKLFAEFAMVRQILTFGGGSGDEAAMLFDLGYRGTHLIYDHPAMLLMQRLWLRYSSVPVVLGEGLEASTKAVQNKIVLESSLGEKVFSHLDASQASNSLFRSTSYFSQEDITSFEKIRPIIKDFGTIQFAFRPRSGSIDTNEYLHKFVIEDLAQTHNVLTWRAKRLGSDQNEVYNFLAALKSHGPLSCHEELNCMPATLHLDFGLFGNIKMVRSVSDDSSSPRTGLPALGTFILGLILLMRSS